MEPATSAITFEQRPEWLKVTIPGQRNRPLLLLYSVLLLVWLAMLAWFITSIATRPGFGFVNLVLLLFWLVTWLWFGRLLWRHWQHHAAGREILFINREQLIVRRPVSILGPTTVYDMQFVTPFYYSQKHRCPAFDYAFQHVYFSQGLPPVEAIRLVARLNAHFFPDQDVGDGV